MRNLAIRLLCAALLPLAGAGCAGFSTGGGEAASYDLAQLAARGGLRATVATRRPVELVEGARRGVRVPAVAGEHPIWVEGAEFSTGTIEVDVRGKNLQGQSFLGVAFGGVNDTTFEAVYLRPFNFRAADPVARGHAVQYVSLPAYPWPRLRSERSEVFENPVEPAPDPTEWVRLKLVVEPAQVRVFVGDGAEPDLVVERLAAAPGRLMGLWVGNGSEGDFANLTITD